MEPIINLVITVAVGFACVLAFALIVPMATCAIIATINQFRHEID
ncbi:MAG: hypothetical protein ACK5XN_03605 [Bacteroidota bacterium]|jgi:hypothetical protein